MYSFAVILSCLFAVNDMQLITGSFEIIGCEARRIVWVIGSAAKHIQIDCPAGIGKMCRDEGRLDQLRHAKALNPRLVAEEHNLRFAISSHFDTVTKLYGKIANGVGILHKYQIAFI